MCLSPGKAECSQSYVSIDGHAVISRAGDNKASFVRWDVARFLAEIEGKFAYLLATTDAFLAAGIGPGYS
jgi:hypothetical protein